MFDGEGGEAFTPAATLDYPVFDLAFRTADDEASGGGTSGGGATLWAATGGGLVQWDLATGTAVVFGEEDGLPAWEVEYVVAAPDGAVWASARDWIARYDGSWQIFSSVENRIARLAGLGDRQVGVGDTGSFSEGFERDLPPSTITSTPITITTCFPGRTATLG